MANLNVFGAAQVHEVLEVFFNEIKLFYVLL